MNHNTAKISHKTVSDSIGFINVFQKMVAASKGTTVRLTTFTTVKGSQSMNKITLGTTLLGSWMENL